MDRKDIKKFIKKVAGYDVPFEFFFSDSKYRKDGKTMQVLWENTKTIIRINKYWFNCKNRIVEYFDYNSKEDAIKSILLHEVGHIKMGRQKSRAMEEYLAQKWAVARAGILRNNKIKNQLEKDIIGWGNFRWNIDKFCRRYILASKIYKKENKI